MNPKLPPKAWVHHQHGDSLHDFTIFLVERELIRASKDGVDYTFLDKQWFADKFLSSSIPDIYVRRKEVFTNERGQKKEVEQKIVFEIESHASKDSIAKKKEHFLESTSSHELYIINLDDYPNQEDLAAIERFRLWLRGRLP